MIGTKQIWKIGDCIDLMQELPDASIDTVITSPPYYNLRDYQVDGQIGMESTLEDYHDRMLDVTAEIYRVMKPTAVLFWNHGDSYGGSGGAGGDYNEGGLRDGQPKVGKGGGIAKSMTMQNERLIIKMIDNQGWILRNRIIWNKPNGMPSSVSDRFSNKYEPVYMLVKNKKYWFDLDAVRVPHKEPERNGTKENRARRKQDALSNWHDWKADHRIYNPLGKNPGDVWTIPTQPYKESHFATFPTKLIEPMIRAACPAEICPVCGLARERMTEKFDFGTADSDTIYPKGNANSLSQKRQAYRKMGFESPPAPKTIGWTSCDCGKPFIAGTVLDPFCGSGTVLEVCRKLNRNSIGFELNPDYEPMIRKRSMSYNPPLSAFFGD